MSFTSALPTNLPKLLATTPSRRSLDVVSGYEYVTSLIRIPADVAEAVELLNRAVSVSDFGTSRYAVTMKRSPVRDLATTSDEYAIARRYDTVLHGLEQLVVGFPVSESPTQDAESAYLRASRRLSTLRQRRYAYAHHWNTLADYAKSVVNILVDVYGRLYKKGYKYYIDPYDKVFECQRILSSYRYLKTGDVIMPEHTNTLIDVVRCLDEIAQQLPSTEEGKTVRRLPLAKEIVLVDIDDWDTAKKYVSDGTIIFVNYGTHALTPEEVRKIVDTIRAVFVVLIDRQPVAAVDVGAFYGVFYTHRNPGECGYNLSGFEFVDEQFRHQFGFYSCSYPGCPIPWVGCGTVDSAVDAKHKIGRAKRWARVFSYDEVDYESCGYSYARYNAGAIIEMPYGGVWRYFGVLDAYIGIISHVLLGERNRCFIAPRAKRVHRIIWMAKYRSRIPPAHDCHPVDQCLKLLASYTGWRLVDLRNEQNV
jgi:hypothetical protein